LLLMRVEMECCLELLPLRSPWNDPTGEDAEPKQTRMHGASIAGRALPDVPPERLAMLSDIALLLSSSIVDLPGDETRFLSLVRDTCCAGRRWSGKQWHRGTPFELLPMQDSERH
jgi:hypothetical protein